MAELQSFLENMTAENFDCFGFNEAGGINKDLIIAWCLALLA